MILQTSCSELLVDTRIHDPEEALARFTALFEKHGWESSPPLSLEVLEQVKAEWAWESDNWEPVEVLVFDGRGNRAWLGYDRSERETGFHLGNDHWLADTQCFPLLKAMVEEFESRVVSDSGTTRYYEEWEAEQASGQSEGDSS